MEASDNEATTTTTIRCYYTTSLGSKFVRPSLMCKRISLSLLAGWLDVVLLFDPVPCFLVITRCCHCPAVCRGLFAVCMRVTIVSITSCALDTQFEFCVVGFCLLVSAAFRFSFKNFQFFPVRSY